MQISKFFMVAMVALSSCATHFQKEGFFTNGYSDIRSGQDVFVVTFRANEHTPARKVKKYAFRRAAQVALKNGYQYFRVIDEIGEAKHLHYPSLRLTIQCYHERPLGVDVIDATEIH